MTGSRVGGLFLVCAAAGLLGACGGSSAAPTAEPSSPSLEDTRQSVALEADTNNGRGTALAAMQRDGTRTIDCKALYAHELSTTYAGAPPLEIPDEIPFEGGCQQAIAEQGVSATP